MDSYTPFLASNKTYQKTKVFEKTGEVDPIFRQGKRFITTYEGFTMGRRSRVIVKSGV